MILWLLLMPFCCMSVYDCHDFLDNAHAQIAHDATTEKAVIHVRIVLAVSCVLQEGFLEEVLLTAPLWNTRQWGPHISTARYTCVAFINI